MGISFSKDGDDVVGTVTTDSIGAAPTSHTHDDRYYTEGEVDNLLGDKQDSATAFDGDYGSLSNVPSTFAPSAHSHTISDVTGLQDALDDKQDSDTAFDGAYASLDGIPSTFAPSAHTHSASDINAGTLGVARGGTGAATHTSGSFLRGAGTGAITSRTPAQVLDDIDAGARNIAIDSRSAAYTLALTNRGGLVILTGATARVFTIPTNASVAFPVGSQVAFCQTGTGLLTITAASGVTLNGTEANSIPLATQYGFATAVKIATNEWVLGGAI